MHRYFVHCELMVFVIFVINKKLFLPCAIVTSPPACVEGDMRGSIPPAAVGAHGVAPPSRDRHIRDSPVIRALSTQSR